MTEATPQHWESTSVALWREDGWMAQAASVVGISQVVCGQEWMPVEVVEGEEAVDVVVPVSVVEMVVDMLMLTQVSTFEVRMCRCVFDLVVCVLDKKIYDEKTENERRETCI